VVGQARSTQRRVPRGRPDEEALRHDVIRLAERFGRYGYRLVTCMLRAEGWYVNLPRQQQFLARDPTHCGIDALLATQPWRKWVPSGVARGGAPPLTADHRSLSVAECAKVLVYLHDQRFVLLLS
jgi:hypothetical protein